MAFPCVVLAFFLVHTFVFHPANPDWVTEDPLKAAEYWLPDLEKFKGRTGIHIRLIYQFTHLPAKAFSWAPFAKVRKIYQRIQIFQTRCKYCLAKDGLGIEIGPTNCFRTQMNNSKSSNKRKKCDFA